MNKQQAINLLKNLEQSLDDYCELNDEGKTAFRMAITALNCSEFPNSSDTISRQAAIDIVEFECGEWSGLARTIVKAIKQLPSAQPEQRWIPCSERLPEEETDVIVCSDKGKIEISSGSWSTELQGKWIWYTEGWRFGKVTAWMPLPEPARLEDE